MSANVWSGLLYIAGSLCFIAGTVISLLAGRA